MEQYVCIHGHFYQPPRENPWLEDVEIQDSAHPYHDWNDRITAECYAPNCRARILDNNGKIIKLVSNYARISFDFGPTLLSWLEVHAPEVYRLILTADKESQGQFSGHGSAMAQAYNHPILPLANQRDKQTQVIWGIRDFRHRFGRDPEGMWLPETAADNETLEVLAEHGIRFTILAQQQAARTRRFGHSWRDVSGSRIDPSRAYLVRLQSGRTISVFFYDGPISRAIAFERLLESGMNFSRRLAGGFSRSRTWPQIVNVATDGETFGHHWPHGDMALADALQRIGKDRTIRLTNYAEFLEKFPPTHEVEIIPRTSWSCAHGVERWRSNCGCNSGTHPSWKQEWRAPLREALDWLRDSLASDFEKNAASLLKTPWTARDGYIEVILDRSRASIERFLAQNGEHVLSAAEITTALKLLEIQRHAMLMYTSCGWFFDEISGIETVQILQYAARALQLVRSEYGLDYEEGFLARLERAPSNLPDFRNGRAVYETLVRPSIIDLEKVGAHCAVSLLFEGEQRRNRIYCYAIKRDELHILRQGETTVALGQLRVTSEITRESNHLTFGVVHTGEHNVVGGVRRYRGDEAFAELVADITEAFNRPDSKELMRRVDSGFGSAVYSLSLLFRDELHRVVNRLLEAAVCQAELLYSSYHGRHSALIHAVSELGTPLPQRLKTVLALTLNSDLRAALLSEKPDMTRGKELFDEIRRLGIDLDIVTLEFGLRKNIERLARHFESRPLDLEAIETLSSLLDFLRWVPFQVDLWSTQNIYYDALGSVYPSIRDRCMAGDEGAAAWIAPFCELGRRLGIKVPGELPTGVPTARAKRRS
jgi:alpha-amylase/alpha-mannosidase (GH57 family)